LIEKWYYSWISMDAPGGFSSRRGKVGLTRPGMRSNNHAGLHGFDSVEAGIISAIGPRGGVFKEIIMHLTIAAL
jgi:hypothetical protein